jgi:hypothetical protein
MLSLNESRILVSLIGACNYESGNKAAFQRLGRKLARDIRARLGYADNNESGAEIRICAGGIAVGGEVILHTPSLYIQISIDRGDILYRTCRGPKDYTGGRNHFHKLEDIATYGVSEFMLHLKAILPHRHECPQCGDVITCNTPKCPNPTAKIATCGAHEGSN